MALAGRAAFDHKPGAGFQLPACAYVQPSDQQARHSCRNDCLRRRRPNWERSMPTTAGGERSRRRSAQDLAGGISPCAHGRRNWLAYAQAGVFDRRPAPESVTSVSGFCPSFRLSPRWHSEVGRNGAEGVLVCANWFSLACCLLGRCFSSAGLRVLRLLGAIEDMATPRLPMAMGTPRGSHARTTRPGLRMAPLSIAHEFGVGEVGGIGVGDGAGGAGVVGDVGRPAGTRRRARL